MFRGWATILGCLEGHTACGVSSSNSTNTTSTTTTTSNSSAGAGACGAQRTCNAAENVAAAGSNTITSAQLQTHNSATDCWMVIGCLVYDLTAYVPRHSGGKGTVVGNCGGDGTASFVGKHPYTYLSVMESMGATILGQPACTVTSGTVGRTDPISLAEVARHGTIDDCWSCISGTVYSFSSYAPDHPGGSQVVSALCGTDGTLSLLLFHSTSVMAGFAVQGSCVDRANTAFTTQNILDACAFVAFIVLPIIFCLATRLLPIRVQDKWLRRPISPPLEVPSRPLCTQHRARMPRGCMRPL